MIQIALATTLVKAALGDMLSGVLGNRADAAVVYVARQVAAKIRKRPDIAAELADAMRRAQIQALDIVIRRYQDDSNRDATPAALFDRKHFAKAALQHIARMPSAETSPGSLTSLATALDDALVASMSPITARHSRRQAERSTLRELRDALGYVPGAFLRYFLRKDVKGPDWFTAYGMSFANTLSTNKDLRELFVVEHLAGAAIDARDVNDKLDILIATRHDELGVIATGAARIEASLASLHSKQDDQATNVSRMLALLEDAAAIARVSAKGLSVDQIERLLTRFGFQGAPIDQAETLLLKAADELKAVRSRLTRLSNSDPDVQRLKRLALEAIDNADLDRARILLIQASERDLSALQEIEQARLGRRLSAAETLGQVGRIASAEASYEDAASCFDRAARIAEPVDIHAAWEHWLDAAAALNDFADIFPGLDALRRAVAIQRRHCLPIADQKGEPSDRCLTLNRLGRTLVDLAGRAAPSEAEPCLTEAEQLCRTALRLCSPTVLPGDFAMSQGLLGDILLQRGKVQAGPAGVALLNEAVNAHRIAVETWAVQPETLKYSNAFNHLAVALRTLSQRLPDARGNELLQEAIETHRRGIDVIDRKAHALTWAWAHNLLGSALLSSAQRMGQNAAIATINAALAAFDVALEIYTPTTQPVAWAMVKGNSGIAHRQLGARQKGNAELLELRAAIAAHEATLSIYSEADMPAAWSQAQNNIGAARYRLAISLGREEGTEVLQMAIYAYQEALRLRPRELTGDLWATTNNNLGLALRMLGVWKGGSEEEGLLIASQEAHIAALAVRSRESTPQDWGMTNANLALAEWALGDVRSDSALKNSAVARMDDVIELFDSLDHADYLAQARAHREQMLSEGS